MKCEETLSKIDGYINNNLNYREMEDFLEHIKNCPDCYDELETYYISAMDFSVVDGIYDKVIKKLEKYYV